MKVKNNYNECLTNLACSIRKYFGLEYKHNTLSYIDELLELKKPKNMVTILCDGMGSKIIERVLDEKSFLITNKLKDITTVFPATTVAATTSMMTGLNPVESGMLGWDMYFKDIDKTITTFMNSEKGDFEYKPLQEAIDFKKRHMKTKSIMDEINEQTQYKGYTLFPFGDNAYKDLDDLFNIIIEKCNEDGKKYIYAYNTEPDSTMHELGTDCIEAKEIILDLNKRIENLSKKLEDTIIFVVADHGHKNVINIDLNEYPDVVECLVRNTSLEPRAVNFFIKPEKKETFEILFKKYFSNDFDLYDKEDVINSKLFGDGEENEIFRDSLGDYLAIGKTDKTILYIGSEALKSQHAGYTDDEIYVPLIVIDTKQNNKDKYINNVINRFSGKSKDILLKQIDMFYNSNNQITKNRYNIGDDVKLKKGTFIHGIFGELENFDFTIENGFISTDFTSEARPNKINNSVGMWNIQEDMMLKEYINQYSGFTISYSIGRGPGSKTISKLIPYHKFDDITEEINNNDQIWSYRGEQTKEVRFIPSLVSNKRQIAFILNMDSDYAKKLAYNDVWNLDFDEETLMSFLDYRYVEKFINEDRVKKDAITTDRESAIMFGLPINLVEGIFVGRKLEKDKKSLEYIKSKLPDCYICNLDGKVIVGNR